MSELKVSKKQLSVFNNLSIACGKFKLPLLWCNQSVEAFLIYANTLYYTMAYLDLQWSALCKLGKKLALPINDDLEADFELVCANCKEITDNKVPVSPKLLSQLCTAAPILFKDYNATLARAMFLCAFAGFMRIYEYSRTRGEHGNKHNLLHDAILLSEDSISISFHSDKAGKNDPTIKHRFTKWSILPDGAKDMCVAYDALHPAMAYNYFCYEDASPLSPDDVYNLLDACLLDSDHRDLIVTAHAFHLGSASSACLHGEHVANLKISGHWHKDTSALEHYLRPDMVVLDPQQLYEKRLKYRREWTVRRLMYIANNVIETPSDHTHPHVLLMNSHYKDYLLHYVNAIPQFHPQQKAIDRMQLLADQVRAGTLSDTMEAQRLLDASVKKYKSSLSKILHREAINLARGAKLSLQYYKFSKISFNKNCSIQTQTDIVTACSASQTEEVFFIDEEDLHLLQHPPHLHSFVPQGPPLAPTYDYTGGLCTWFKLMMTLPRNCHIQRSTNFETSIHLTWSPSPTAPFLQLGISLYITVSVRSSARIIAEQLTTRKPGTFSLVKGTPPTRSMHYTLSLRSRPPLPWTL